MGDQADDILLSFQLFEEDKKKYDIVLAKFQGHFVKRRNVIYERMKFNQRIQQVGESVESFITDLYALSDTCNYGELTNKMIRPSVSHDKVKHLKSNNLRFEVSNSNQKLYQLKLLMPRSDFLQRRIPIQFHDYLDKGIQRKHISAVIVASHLLIQRHSVQPRMQCVESALRRDITR